MAEVLHKTASEILQMSVTEFNMWIAYFELKREEQERQDRINKMKRREWLQKKYDVLYATLHEIEEYITGEAEIRYDEK